MKKDETLTRYSQQLRKHATKEENTLWYQYLRHYPVRFRRQYVIEPYIVDFYCAKAKLIVELDGSQHYMEDGIQKDTVRTEYLESQGLMVLRFPNNAVNRNLRGVCEQIDSVVQKRLLDFPASAAPKVRNLTPSWEG